MSEYGYSKYLASKRNQLHRMTYTGPNKILFGSTALVKLEGDKAMAQFDHKDRGRLCFGWHEFKASDFTPIEEPKPAFAPEYGALRQAENRRYRHSYAPGEVVMIEMEDLSDDRIKAMLAQKRAVVDKAMVNFIHVAASKEAFPE